MVINRALVKWLNEIKIAQFMGNENGNFVKWFVFSYAHMKRYKGVKFLRLPPQDGMLKIKIQRFVHRPPSGTSCSIK